MLNTPTTAINLTSYITERSENFTGREWVFAEIDRWLADLDAPRYFIIIGEPGIGKTSIAARLTQLYYPAAVHFCIARQADTLDPLNFSRSISHQLTSLNGFAQCLLEEVGINVEANINVQENYGQIVGVRIEKLIAASTSATSAFIRTVVAPLKQLYLDGFEQQQLILVDALDEAVQYQGTESIVDLLASSQGLPSKVRFILTSRPDSAALRHFEEQNIQYLMINARQDENLLDVRKYIENRILSSEASKAQLVKLGMKVQTFIDRAITASQGNFLYLVWLLSSIEVGTQRFDALDILPKGLDGIYRKFLRTRIVGKDTQLWRTRYRILLGVLAVAKMPLTLEQLVQFTGLGKQVVVDSLQDMQQFLDLSLVRQKKYELYHQSVTDFVSSEEYAHEFWIDLVDFHKLIVASYRRMASTWEGVNWGNIDDYGMQYLAVHLFALKDNEANRHDLYMLICKSFMREKQVRYGSFRSFAENVLLAIETAMSEKPPNLVQEIRGSLIYATLGSLATNVPPKVLAILADLGEATRAIEFAIIMQDSEKQSEAFRLISKVLLSKSDLGQAKVVLLQALEAADTIFRDEAKVDALNKIAQILIRAGDPERAVIVADRMLEVAKVTTSEFSSVEPLKASTLSKLAQILFEVGDSEQAITIAKRALATVDGIENEYSQATTLKKVAKILSRAGLVDRVLESTEEIKAVEDKLIVLRGVGELLAQIGDFSLAEAVADQALISAEIFEDKRQKAEELSKVAQILSQIGKQARAEYILTQAMKVTETIGNQRRRAIMLSELAQILAHIVEDNHVFEIIEAIQNEVDKALVLSEVAKVLIEEEDSDRALNVINRMLEVAEVITSEYSNDDLPKAAALTKVAQVLYQAGDSERVITIAKRVLEIVETIEDEETKSIALLEMAQVLVQSGEINRLFAVIETIIDETQKRSAWTRMAEAFAETGHFDQAIEAVEALEDEDWKSTALELVATNLARAGRLDQALEAAKASKWKSTLMRLAEALLESEQVDRALEVVEAIEDESDKVAVLSKMTEVLTQEGEHVRAVAVANQVLVTAEALTSRGYANEFSKVSALVSVAEEFAQKGEYARAEAVATQALVSIKRESSQVTKLCNIAKVFVQIGEPNRASAIATQALTATAAPEENNLSKVFDLTSVAKVLAELGELTRAEAVAKQALAMAESMGNGNGYELGIVANVFVQIGQLTRAEAIATQALTAVESLEDEREKQRELAHLGWLFAEANLIDQVFLVIESLTDDEWKAWSFRMIAETFVQLREPALAKAFAINASTLIETLKSNDQKAMNISEIAQVFVQIEELELAKDIAIKALKETEKMIESVNNPWHAITLANVAQVLYKLGKNEYASNVLTQALKATESIEYKGDRLMALNKLIQNLFDAVQQDHALKVLRNAFAVARQDERASVFMVLASGATTLSAIDRGRTLWNVYEAIQEVEEWWGK